MVYVEPEYITNRNKWLTFCKILGLKVSNVRVAGSFFMTNRGVIGTYKELQHLRDLARMDGINIRICKSANDEWYMHEN